jgi:RNA polymerase primary sigma factor
MSPFGIQIDDGGDTLPQFVVEHNNKAVELHNWQQRAIEYFFNNNNTAILEVTTGAGKTICAIEILKKIHEENPKAMCLIVVPKNVILETGWYGELYKSGYSLADIGVYYGLGKEYAKITITNMQSIHRVAIDLFDVVIFDEVHNYCTKRLFPYIEHPFKYKLALSATIERMDKGHWHLLKVFDYNVFKYTPHQAIQEGILNPFNFYNIGVEMDLDSYEEYLELTKELNLLLKSGGGFSRIMRTTSGIKFKMLSLMNKRKQLVNNYYRKFEVAKIICMKHPTDKTLVFNQFNAQTSKLYWHLLEVGIQARILHSGIKKEDRDKTLSDFKKDVFNILLATRVLDEGYNLPAISCAIIMAGDSTAKQTIQRMGRVLRRKKKESLLYQVYCKGTIEEEQAIERAKLFKELSSHYNDYVYELEKELVLDE